MNAPTIEDYLNAGLCLVPIAAGSKGPTHKGWNLRENCTVPDDHQGNIGLAHAYSSPPTMALDLDDLFVADMLLAAQGINLQALLNAPDAVQVSSGRQNSGKLLYRLPAAMASKKISIGGKTMLELRCATAEGNTVQDVIHGVHPSGSTYQWAGKGHYSNIPTIPEALLTYWQGLLTKDSERVISVPGEVNANWNEIAAALACVPPDTTYDNWIACGMALHYSGAATGEDSQAFVVWDDWSQKGSKYRNPADLEFHWKSFKTTHPNGTKLGSLFYIAREHGWVRPVPDVTQLFGNVAPTSPQIIKSLLTAPPPRINPDVFPKALRDRALHVAKNVGCDPTVPLLAGLAAVMAALDKRCRLKIREDYMVPPILWITNVGDPGEKKTPGSTPMFAPLAKIEQEDMPAFKASHLEWQARETAYAASMKAYLKEAENPLNGVEAADGSTDTSALIKPQPLPPEPVPLQLTVGDATTQKLVRILAGSERGVVMVLDELSSLLKKMNSTTTTDDRGCIVTGYEGNGYKFQRVGAGDIPVFNHAIGIYGCVQPEILKQYAKLMATDGAMQRFIPGILNPDLSGVGDNVQAAMNGAMEWDALLRNIYRHQKPREIILSPEAYALWRVWEVEAEQLKRDLRNTGYSSMALGAHAKLDGTAGRVALLFHVATHPLDLFSPVSAETMGNAIAFVKHYVSPSILHMASMLSGNEDLDIWVMNHVLQVAPDQDVITMGKLRNSARVQIDGMADVVANSRLFNAMERLADLGWVALIEDKGRSIVWAISPTLKTAFVEHRQALKEARERIISSIRQSAMEKRGE